jgi:gliding motility-associated-like protein
MRIRLCFAAAGALTFFASGLHADPGPSLSFAENKGQWPAQVVYKSDIPSGHVFFGQNNLVFSFYSQADLDRVHEEAHDSKSTAELRKIEQQKIRCYAYYLSFEGANESPAIIPGEKQTAYSNYFLGNDAAKWAGYVAHYDGLTYESLYPGVDAHFYSAENNLKYDFILAPGIDPSIIKMKYDGLTTLRISNGKLIFSLGFMDVAEAIPYAYQVIGGVKKEVRFKYALNGNTVSFKSLDAIDPAYELIIDPVIVASTYSGATVTTYGHSATYDGQGNIYSAGRCFGTGFPVTAGAYDLTFAGSVDMAISKYNPTGTTLIFATYIGGTSDEYAQSMFAQNGELYIYGCAGSTNYPTTPGAVSATNAGMYDIVVTHLDAAGASLLGSTYVGGSANDGYNSIYTHYGDPYRGEIIVDASGNALIASFSSSSNFPVTSLAYDQTLGGGQDGVVIKLTPTMTSLIFATFIGGSADDAAFGIRLNSSGEVYACGATGSSNFPVTPGTYQGTYGGGTYDGFLVRFDPGGSFLFASTFFGTNGLDEAFFMDIDYDDDVYIYGEAAGGAPVTAGVYSNAGAKMFVAKFDPGLTNLLVGTVIGDPTTTIAPSAFLVDNCKNIYLAGFGASAGYPVSANAFYPSTAVGSCYLAVLSPGATALLFATFYGGWHVDGGTSRFDPAGIVYHAVCQGGAGFPTNSNAWNTGGSPPSWDVCVFKIDFQQTGVQAVASATATSGCAPFPASFINNSTGVNYIWDFGDGSPLDTNTTPSHLYVNAGTYTVTLIAIDSLACLTSDTTQLTIVVLAPPVVNLGNDTTLCDAPNFPLDAGNPGSVYNWSTGATTQTINITGPGIYWVTVGTGTCIDTDSISVQLIAAPDLGSDTTVCSGTPVTLDAGNPGSTYLWSTGATTQTITVSAPGTFSVTVTAAPCQFTDTINVMHIAYPVVNLGNDTVLCPNETVIIDAENPGSEYLWNTGDTTQQLTVSATGTYAVLVSNLFCTATDTMRVLTTSPVDLGSDINLCDQLTVTLQATVMTGANYLWSTGETTSSITVSEAATYWVTAQSGSCIITDTINVEGGFGQSALYVPNCFTPNGDTKNEIFYAVGEDITTFHMMIFDRWGQLLFETDDLYSGWDGTYKGNTVQIDVYVVVVEYTTKCSGQKKRDIRHVTVEK